MKAGRSAGLLLYRISGAEAEVLLVHPGGPFWRRRWHGAWQIPKGMIEPGETPLAAARREFAEELGALPAGEPWPLGSIRQAGGKVVEAFALAGAFDPAGLRSNHFTLEWPPRSNRLTAFPEVDAVRWFALAQARSEILPSQAPLLDLLEERLREAGG